MDPICDRACHWARQTRATRLRDHDLPPVLRTPDRPALRSYGPAWIADFRDGWTFESQRPDWAHPWPGALDRRLEREVVQRADAVSAVTQPIADDLAERFRRPVTTITNGFDPESVEVADEDGKGICRAIAVELVHTGTLSYGGRSIQPLVEAFRILHSTSQGAADALEIALVGPVTDAERDAVNRAGMSHAFSLPGVAPARSDAGRPARRRRVCW